MVEIKDIDFGYKRGLPLFKQLNLSLAPGHVYGLLGKNGAGKSTLLKHISGLLFPKKGKVEVFGYQVQKRLPEMLADVYVIPEEFELPAITIAAFTSGNAVFYPQFNKEQFEKYLREFEVPIGSKLTGLSYGQQKKFLISFGLATNARMFILDEPTNGLDIPSKSQFRKIVASSLDEERLIIISTHQVRDLENLIDAVVILENGQIIFNHTISNIAEKLSFDDDLTDTLDDEIIYSEQVHGKRAGIIRNITGLETRVDLELLFNALLSDNQLFKSKF